MDKSGLDNEMARMTFNKLMYQPLNGEHLRNLIEIAICLYGLVGLKCVEIFTIVMMYGHVAVAGSRCKCINSLCMIGYLSH